MAPTDFVTPKGSRWTSNGKLLGTVFVRVKRQQGKVFRGHFLLLRPFFLSSTQEPSERMSGEVKFLELPVVGLLGLRKVISSHQPLDYQGSAFPGYRQWVCRNSVAISRREKSFVVVKNDWERGGRYVGHPSGSHETPHPGNPNGWQGSPRIERGSPSNGLWRHARPTLERCRGERVPPRESTRLLAATRFYRTCRIL